MIARMVSTVAVRSMCQDQTPVMSAVVVFSTHTKKIIFVVETGKHGQK